jgi:ribosomal protein L32
MSSRKRRHPSNAWWQLRANHLAAYPECRVCGVVDHVHHLCYRGQKGTSERPGDLITLCELDHNGLHHALGQRGLAVPPQLEWIANARAVVQALENLM